MLVNNRKIIREVNETIYKRLLEIEQEVPSHVRIEPAKKEGETLGFVTNDNQIYFHSKYNPIKEAQTFSEQFNELENPEHVLFIGAGLGYHIAEILIKFPNTKYSIYEPNIYLLSIFLAKQDLAKFKPELVNIFTSKEDIHDFNEFTTKYVSRGEIVRWPVTNNVFGDEIKKFDQDLSEVLKEKKFNLAVSAAHQYRWQINGIVNFLNVMTTPHVFDLDVSSLKNKPVVIVAAGPSLSFDIHLIKKIKEEKRAYIFAVGSAINALIEQNIMPDVFVSFDPKSTNYLILDRLKEKQWPIPLFYGSTIGFEALKDYPGPMFHFFVEQETISPYFIDIRKDHILSDKPSVAVMTLEICAKLNMGPIILAGQNCAFLDNKRYATEIEYKHVTNELTEQEKKEQIEIESVDGETIFTNESHLALLRSLERNIKYYNLDNVYNTTKQGAKIKGTTFVNIEEMLTDKLIDTNVVNCNWLNSGNSYNRKDILNRYEKLENNFDEMMLHIKEVSSIINTIMGRQQSKLYKNLNSFLRQYDFHFDAIHANLFYQVVLEPMIRVQREKFLARAHEVQQARLEKTKMDKFIEIHVSYIRAIFAAIVVVQDGFKELNQIKSI